MAGDENNQTPVNNASQQPSAGGTPSNQVGNTPSGNQADPVKMAEEMGRLKAENQKLEAEYKDYVTRVDPVVQTLLTDKELLDKVTESNNKRLGITPEPKGDSNDPNTLPPVSKEVKEIRNDRVVEKVNDFYSRHGLDKLPDDQKLELDQKVSMVLKETLNPTGGKSLAQILEDVPLEALAGHLDKAYYWATREQREKEIKEQTLNDVQNEGLGVIGGMPSGSGSSDEVTLTQKEMETIKKSGWEPAKYLENKKEIAKRNNQLY